MKNVNKFVNKTVDLFDGKKNYIVGILMVGLGLLNSDQKMILEGLGFIFLRQAQPK